MHISIIIPVLNEAENIERVLDAAASLAGADKEVIVVDGGSHDDTAARAMPLADRVIRSERGRARQMNVGASVAQGDVLLFLHADTVLPHNALALIDAALRNPARAWGRFDVRIEGKPLMLQVVAAMMNLRSRLTGIATGDQAMFVRRNAFAAARGFPEQPLMEDVELSARLRERSPPVCLRERVSTSGRRWEQRGVWSTIFLMWRLRLLYWLGAAPEKLAQAYR